MTIDEKILNIDSLRFAIKIEINSYYHGIVIDREPLKQLYNKQYELKMQRNKLVLMNERLKKINKINGRIIQ